MRFLALLAMVLVVAGCQCGPDTASVAAASYAPAASPCAPAAAAPRAQVAGYKATAGSTVRTAFRIPGGLVTCFGNFLRCAGDELFPIVPPDEPVYASAPASAYAPAAAPAAPCMVPETVYESEQYTEMVPVIRTRSVPKTRMVPAPPPPPAMPASGPCSMSGSASDPCPNGCCPIPAIAGR